ncbi:two-component sensor histidine kinase [Marinobacterium nitratireducens]|uniref:histidine kinase n=1 Tax=Marinobacterium nitratireducens TaxID=518897 RepID=A0A917ZKN6_9GAMM|nr:ATP-binding protein [Marinobacterium nitratireducens]GGO85624.1 two-component sensor histidine kinase [Marinobacterium nitratireducens]
MRSIRRFMLLTLLLLLSLSAMITVFWTYLHSSHEVEEVFDASLVQNAKVLHGQVIAYRQRAALQELQRSVSLERLDQAPDDDDYHSGNANDPGHPYEYQVGFQAGSLDGELWVSTPPDFPVVERVEPGFMTVGEGDNRWRLYTLRNPELGIWVRSGHRMAVRDELTGQIAAKLLLPIVVVLPGLLLLLSLGIRRGLAPLETIRQSLASRRSDDLQPLPSERLPSELVPVVGSMNDLFARVASTLDRERRFTADAAHELRTPLAALRIHLEKLRLPETQSADLMCSIDRMERVVTQLLMLARIEPQRGKVPLKPLNLSQRCCSLVAELYPKALERGLSIEFEEGADLQVAGDETLLDILLRNLIENAIRYTCAEDVIRVRLSRESDRACIEVIDHGRGIAEADRQKVLERFYREGRQSVEGAGLGLSIVVLIVELHNGELRLEETPGGGLTVRVLLPGI